MAKKKQTKKVRVARGARSTPAPAVSPEFLEALERVTRVLDTKAAQELAAAIRSYLVFQQAQVRRNARFRRRVHIFNLKVHRTNQLVLLGGLLICLSFLFGVIWLLKGDKDTLLPVVSGLIGLIAGAGGGWLFGQRTPSASENSR